MKLRDSLKCREYVDSEELAFENSLPEVGVVVVVVIVYLKHLRVVLKCAKAGCGRRTSSS